MKFLADTNVFAEALKPKPNAKLMRRLKRHQAEIVVAAPVWHEMWFGCLRLPKGSRQETIERYLTRVLQPALLILPYSRSAAEWHAKERARLVSKGRTPAFVDGQIASIAAENDLTVVTSNREDFTVFRGIKVVDWRR